MGKYYTNEYKEYVAKMVAEEGRKGTEVAYELEIPYATMMRWVKLYNEKKAAEQSGEHITPSELEKLKKAHDKELKALKEENEILKKAMHIFTQKPE
ncbi:transposase [Bacillus sp. V3]|nr:transposase [Bacillus sp. V3]QTC42951.1 transposase [Bacillus sp. V3]QTC43035.1 transposase [Bacillus sp. V3]QTC43083.1 transposase [Bacillus sp. V3]